MAINKISVEEFLKLAENNTILDVRSPGEYVHAHIPGAVSFPLFTDEERKVVGTTYKQQSREDAIKIGLTYFGPNMLSMVEKAEAIVKARGENKKLLVHCWRGGMRSAAVAWLLDLYGFEVYLLAGGYKSFRQWILTHFEKQYKLNVLGGYTGSGKTYVLHELLKAGKAVINLEALASHKGSAFGAINMPPQPSQEMFENMLGLQLNQYENNEEGIWIEDESQRIGSVNIPINFWHQMRSATLFFLDIDFEKRLQHIVSGYGSCDKEKLVNAIIRIQKRLGGLETKTAVNFIIENNFTESFRILLKYYDKLYNKALYNRENLENILHKIYFDDVNPVLISNQLLKEVKQVSGVLQ